jgi:hypothetical protein
LVLITFFCCDSVPVTTFGKLFQNFARMRSLELLNSRILVYLVN